jgi:hypothetical protein
MAEEKNYFFPMIAIVAIVAIVGLVVMFKGTTGYTLPESQDQKNMISSEQSNLMGKVYTDETIPSELKDAIRNARNTASEENVVGGAINPYFDPFGSIVMTCYNTCVKMGAVGGCTIISVTTSQTKIPPIANDNCWGASETGSTYVSSYVKKINDVNVFSIVCTCDLLNGGINRKPLLNKN